MEAQGVRPYTSILVYKEVVHMASACASAAYTACRWCNWAASCHSVACKFVFCTLKTLLDLVAST